MRFVEITIPTGKREAILGALEDEGIDYVVSDEVSGRDYTAVASFPLPATAVEPVLDRLREVGLDDDAYTVVLNAETVISRRFEALEDRYAEDEESEDRIAREELRTRAASLAPELPTYALMVIVSVVVATAGVLLDSAAVVVGSMVIAPLIGPAMATSVGTVLRDRELFVRGTKLQLLGFLLAVVGAAAFAWLVKAVHLVPLDAAEVVAISQVRERLAPDFLSLAIALGAGVAGAVSLSTGVSTALVGVMIAVALVPPVAVIGIGIAWGLPSVVAGATVLVLVNFLSINLAALAVLWYQGYRPRYWFREDEARAETLKRIGALLAAIAVLSVFLGGVTYASFQSATLEEAVRSDVERVLESDAYDELSLLDVEVERRGPLPTDPPERVVVTVERPPGTAYPSLAEAIADRIDRDLAVAVRFVEVDRAG